MGFFLKKSFLIAITDTMFFLCLTAIVARTSHYYFNIPYKVIIFSVQFHLLLLIVWGVFGIFHMLIGHKKAMRGLWLAGVIVTIADIIKLLVVDLANTGTITRIISFFIAGLFLLFIGWAAPLPPAILKKNTGENR
jgi:uncharacterized membrane protein